MNKYKAKNEKVKRAYFKWLTGAKGHSIKTIECIEKALWDYEAFSLEDDYANFNKQVAGDFKKWLSNKKIVGDGIISLSTQYDRLRHVNNFFTWLSGQSGYKSKINVYDVAYLQLDKRLSQIARAPKVENYPTLEYVIKLCKSIEIKGEIDLRDRALIAFTLLSGMRDNAIITLPLGCFNPDKLEVEQNPKKGVQTKFSKTIYSILFQFDETLLSYVLDWYNHLKEEKIFGVKDPLFPSTKVEQMSDTEYTFEAKGVEPVFWKSTNTIRKVFKTRCENAKIEYFSPHKYRHGTIRLAHDSCKNPEQIKAVSQNLGHERIETTLLTYGKINTDRVKDVIRELNFKKTSEDEIKAQMKKLALQL